MTAIILLAAMRQNALPTHGILHVGKYVAEWRERKISEGDPWGWWGAAETNFWAIDSLDIHLGHERIKVPRSAYSDLAHVRTFSGVPTSGGCRLRIEGGDASESYVAEIVLRGTDVKSRSVQNPAFPQYCNERSQYTNLAPPEPSR